MSALRASSMSSIAILCRCTSTSNICRTCFCISTCSRCISMQMLSASSVFERILHSHSSFVLSTAILWDAKTAQHPYPRANTTKPQRTIQRTPIGSSRAVGFGLCRIVDAVLPWAGAGGTHTRVTGVVAHPRRDGELVSSGTTPPLGLLLRSWSAPFRGERRHPVFEHRGQSHLQTRVLDVSLAMTATHLFPRSPLG